jgi:hypothetical protein
LCISEEVEVSTHEERGFSKCNVVGNFLQEASRYSMASRPIDANQAWNDLPFK